MHCRGCTAARWTSVRCARASRSKAESMTAFDFEPVALPASVAAFRADVRAFLRDELPALPAERRANSWAVFDADFSRKLGARGWIGLTWPKRHGGGERSPLERYVLLEEL